MSNTTIDTFFHQNPVSFRLEVLCYDVHSGIPATGSVWKWREKIYLVTNWHVLSGRSTYTGKPLLESCATPIRLILHYMKPYPLSTHDHATEGLRVELVDKNGDPVWLQHQEGKKWDIACVELSKECPISSGSMLPHRLEGLSVFEVPGLDVFIMGFPDGLVKQGGHPVWKRGSLASFPQSLSDGLPITLVDTASRPGMSGSPVFFVNYSGQPLFPPASMKKYSPYKFAGIYSGRYPSEPDSDLDKEFRAQLGRVWWPHLVTQMLENPHPARWLN